MAKSASKNIRATDICSFDSGAEPLFHGGDLASARKLFPDAPQPFIDLSTGINPIPYRLPRLPADLFARLPESAAASALADIAAHAYGAPSAAQVVPAPGTQILLPLVAELVRPGRAAVMAPTYGEFARAAALAGHAVVELRELAEAEDASLVFVANPNNPDGRLFPKVELIAFAKALRARGGMLVVDEAFMEVGPTEQSLAAEVAGNIVVLRSFGKFFGLAGIRLGFALAAPPLAAHISARLGPWAVSAPALVVGAQALTDAAWIEKARSRLEKSARRLDSALNEADLELVGGTALFRLVRSPAAQHLFRHLGRAGIVARIFPENPEWLRFGLPANEEAWRRLQIALAAFRRTS
jgi:cobalamin biosynthesis protein CobC